MDRGQVGWSIQQIEGSLSETGHKITKFLEQFPYDYAKEVKIISEANSDRITTYVIYPVSNIGSARLE